LIKLFYVCRRFVKRFAGADFSSTYLEQTSEIKLKMSAFPENIRE